MMHTLLSMTWGEVIATIALLWFLYTLIIKQGMIGFGPPPDCDCAGEKPKPTPPPVAEATGLPPKPTPPPERIIREGRKVTTRPWPEAHSLPEPPARRKIW